MAATGMPPLGHPPTGSGETDWFHHINLQVAVPTKAGCPVLVTQRKAALDTVVIPLLEFTNKGCATWLLLRIYLYITKVFFCCLSSVMIDQYVAGP